MNDIERLKEASELIGQASHLLAHGSDELNNLWRLCDTLRDMLVDKPSEFTL